MALGAVLTVILTLALLAAPLAADAQPAGKRVPRMGYLDGASLNAVRIEALRQGLRELGYVEGRDIAFEWRSAEGKAERLPGLAAELVRLKVDVIVTGGAGATRPAKEATSAIPIVMAQDGDPVGSGFVASLARPGGNITGTTLLASGLSAKRLGLLKEIVPRLSRVLVLSYLEDPIAAPQVKELDSAAHSLGVKLMVHDIGTADDL